ncbi:chromate transporter [Spirochaeta isovalerica]|uniref:Chromate transporter n=1 Tax=Spirochaeta isovalerica TaxID=150 RepID=A0A841RAW4_9SPIO|nr:chromate transporter [Spirochaeta isovalerica]MBB6480059.1 chromate transporter [Spirochaeta isovalerica]
MSLIELFITFFKIGLFTIGGGLASLPLLKEAVVDGGFITSDEFIDMVAISQSTPGPIGINMATYTGFKLASVPGGVVATAGIVTPSLIIIILIAALMKNFASSKAIQDSLSAIRPAALGLIASAVWFILSEAVLPGGQFFLPGFLIMTAILIARSLWKATPVLYIMAGAIAGIIFL